MVAKDETGTLHIVDCGIADYRKVLEQQQRLHAERVANRIPDTALLVEHTPVITLGARASANRLLVDRAELARRGIEVVEIRRGGGTTAHNPGQIVFYPIVHLPQRKLNVSGYVRLLEGVGIDLLAALGVQAQRRTGFPGLWTGERKIASIGVRVAKGVTYHGMAVNIQNDLAIFDLIVPCGLDGVEMTSVLKETGKHHAMEEVKRQLAEVVIRYFA